MNKPHFNSWKQPHVSQCKRHGDDPVVMNGLSITPAQMMELTRQGFAIGAQNARMLQEVKSMSVGEVPLEYRRGFDIADGYQAQQEVRGKARKLRDGLIDGTVEKISITPNE